MRRIPLLLLLGCGLLTFTVEDDTTTTVEGSLVGELLGVLDLGGLDDFDITIEQEMADQGVEPGDLESVTLTELTLSAPDLSFVSSMEVYVSADGVAEVLVASAEDFASSPVTFDMSGANLADHVVAGGMLFRVDAAGGAPAEDTDIDVHVEVRVEATTQGACNAAKEGR
jgi:hypothetical protein